MREYGLMADPGLLVSIQALTIHIRPTVDVNVVLSKDLGSIVDRSARAVEYATLHVL